MCETVSFVPSVQHSNEGPPTWETRSGMQCYQCLSCNMYLTPGATRVISLHEQHKHEQVWTLAQQGMSLRAIARQMGVHHETVRRWHSEKQTIHSRT